MRIGMDLNSFILNEERRYPSATGSLSRALVTIESATKVIASHVRMAGLVDVLGKAEKINIQGEEVQKLDELSNSILIDYLSNSGEFFALASEELDEPIFPEEGRDAKYVIAFDPLDGSSNIDVNVNIGTIFSIHRRVNSDISDFLQEGYKQVAAGYIIYGSSTMFILSTGNGVNGFTLDPSVGMFILSHPDIKLPEKGKIYSFNESNIKKWEPQTLVKYVEALKEEGYTSRYIGSMVADVHRTIIKGGVFAYPADKKNKNGKLRLLYEASPMAFLTVQAGGLATAGYEDILNIKPTDIHQRVPVFLGSRKEINQLLEFVEYG
ncbi:MAG: class 1 fructose-bisphosphatase [Hydrogenothermaceae bacterium]|nr:class 1 fructose-bisphosphatase [Hydrogenothermaceae bacterium]